MSNRDIAKRYLEGSGHSEQPKLQDMYKQVVINEVLGPHVTDPYPTKDISLYARDNNKSTGKIEHVADVDKEYYDDILGDYINRGSSDNMEARKMIEQKLDKAGGLINNNLDVFQTYCATGNFDLNEQNFEKFAGSIVSSIQSNSTVMLSDLVNNSFTQATVLNEYLYPPRGAWACIPEAPVHGAPGEGELYLAFFGNGIKPDKGDLSVGGREVELKGPGGRLFKTKGLSMVVDMLMKQPLQNDASFAKAAAECITINSGTEELSSDVQKFITNNPEISNSLYNDYQYLMTKRKFRPSNTRVINLFLYLMGLCQMIMYRNTQGFDSLLLFERVNNDYALQFIDMQNIKSVVQLYDVCMNMGTHLKFSRRADGKGFAISISLK